MVFKASVAALGNCGFSKSLPQNFDHLRVETHQKKFWFWQVIVLDPLKKTLPFPIQSANDAPAGR